MPDSRWVFNDVQIEVRGKSAQVDHVLVSSYGLWCIETKSLRGTIYGKERDRRWTQVKRSETGRIFREQFYNPVSQNAAHCCRLAEYLKGRIGLELPIRSVVVFAGARLQVEATTPVVRLAELRQVIEASDTVP